MTSLQTPSNHEVEATSRASGYESIYTKLAPYIAIARPDHWFKNSFMLPGVILALSYNSSLCSWSSFWQLVLAVAATCLVASSNYVINELIDAPNDRHHPVKSRRPAVCNRINRNIATSQWLILGALGMAIAFSVNPSTGCVAGLLWVMGLIYNVRPIRAKELPYLDVLSESINNPLRLLLGWFPLVPHNLPPLSLIISYWMVGAFFMALKRLAEYRTIQDKEVASQYRRSFAYYNEDRLLISSLFYASACALFTGIFIVRFHVELILFIPMAAGFLSYYLKIALQPNSPVQNPERLYRENGFFAYTIVSSVIFAFLMFVSIPFLYDLFQIATPETMPLWTIGKAE